MARLNRSLAVVSRNVWPEDVLKMDVLKVDADDDGNGGDDAADALRYLVATKTRSVVQRKLRGL